MGDILPNQASFIFNKRKSGENTKPPVDLGNVTKKVHNAILAVLDMYFACNCSEYTIQQTFQIEKLGTIMEAHIQVLWNLKQAIMYEKPRDILMRKLHAHNHIGEFIRQFGPILFADTDAYESSHKFFTTGVWRGTSKKLGTLTKEMFTASMIQTMAGHLKFYATLSSEDGISNCKQKFGPKIVSDGLIINAFTNVADIRFVVTSVLDKDGITYILKGVGSNKELFQESIFVHNSLPSSKHLSQYLHSYFKERVWNAMTIENTMVEFSIVRCMSYEGSKESNVGKGVLYATADNFGKGPRYDFITVKTEQTNNTGEIVDSYDLAQVLIIIQVHVYEYKENKRVLKNENNWYLIVQYMQPNSGNFYKKPQTIQHEAIKKYSWEMRDKRTTEAIPADSNTNFYIDMISIDSMAGSAMVIPYFSSLTKKKSNQGTITQKLGAPKIGKPNLSGDMFWYVDRKLFDRSGYEELNTTINDTNEVNVDNIELFLNENYVECNEPESISLPPSPKRSRLDFEEFLSDYDEENMLVDENDSDDED